MMFKIFILSLLCNVLIFTNTITQTVHDIQNLIPETEASRFANSFLFNTACPTENEKHRTIVENFLTKSYWSQERADTDTDHLTISQITVLNDLVHTSACSTFNDLYQEALTEDNGLGEHAYSTTYYKVGTFYFVAISIRQSDTPGVVSMGLSYLHIYNDSKELIEAYVF
ncbi:MAG: hypothetical protein JJ895_09110 [Balneolaceae bacterium]|nr:hypothetical protein [Balneolaceae bacterium]